MSFLHTKMQLDEGVFLCYLKLINSLKCVAD